VIGHDAATVHKMNDYVGLHPALGPWRLIQAGTERLIQGSRVSNPNRSHFPVDWTSGERLQVSDQIVGCGWPGRFFDNECPGCDPRWDFVGQQLPLAIARGKGDAAGVREARGITVQRAGQRAVLKLNRSEKPRISSIPIR
jgi:uncharacterized protein (DUF1501 family)